MQFHVYIEFHPAQFVFEQMFHQDPTFERRAGQRRILAFGPGVWEQIGWQFAEEKATGARNEQEEQLEDRRWPIGRK